MGPGISARMTCIELPDSVGIIAIMSTSTPMPPIQCVKLRQKSIPWLIASTSVTTEAPVVVKPLTVSKSASIYDGISREMKNGSAPMSESTIHARATVIKPSRTNISVVRGFDITVSSTPMIAAEAAAAKKANSWSHSRYMAQTSIGSTSRTASSSVIFPTVLPIILRFIAALRCGQVCRKDSRESDRRQ